MFRMGLIVVQVLFLALTQAHAQDAATRIRGAIERVEGDVYIVKLRDGTDARIKLTEKASVVAIINASVADIKAGTFVGVAAQPQPDGSQRALEVHIFPEAMRGTGEGHRPWDLEPGSTMTNANVEDAKVVATGHEIKLRYKDGEKLVRLTPETPIVQYAPAEVSELKAGARIFIGAAKKLPDGTYEAARINVGRDRPPPM